MKKESLPCDSDNGQNAGGYRSAKSTPRTSRRGRRSRTLDYQNLIALAEKAKYRVPVFAHLQGLSPRQLERIWQRDFGETPRRWMDKVRLVKAAEALAEGRTVKETAWQFEFQDRANFFRRFREIFGSTPNEFVEWAQRKHRIDLEHFAQQYPKRQVPPELKTPFGHLASRYLRSYEQPLRN